MGLLITRSQIDEYRRYLKDYEPYAKDDPIIKRFDGGTEPHRRKATMLRDLLEALGLDPYDDNDYGDISE